MIVLLIEQSLTDSIVAKRCPGRWFDITTAFGLAMHLIMGSTTYPFTFFHAAIFS